MRLFTGAKAALFQFDKVKTPVHLVQGEEDVRVSYLEGVTMERALDSLGIPHRFLVFPGRGAWVGEESVARIHQGAGRAEVA